MSDLTNTEITKKICAIEGLSIVAGTSPNALKEGLVLIINNGIVNTLISPGETVLYNPKIDFENVRLRDKYKVTVDYVDEDVYTYEWIGFGKGYWSICEIISYKETGIDKAVLLAIIEAYDNRS